MALSVDPGRVTCFSSSVVRCLFIPTNTVGRLEGVFSPFMEEAVSYILHGFQVLRARWCIPEG